MEVILRGDGWAGRRRGRQRLRSRRVATPGVVDRAGSRAARSGASHRESHDAHLVVIRELGDLPGHLADGVHESHGRACCFASGALISGLVSFQTRLMKIDERAESRAISGVSQTRARARKPTSGEGERFFRRSHEKPEPFPFHDARARPRPRAPSLTMPGAHYQHTLGDGLVPLINTLQDIFSQAGVDALGGELELPKSPSWVRRAAANPASSRRWSAGTSCPAGRTSARAGRSCCSWCTRRTATRRTTSARARGVGRVPPPPRRGVHRLRGYPGGDRGGDGTRVRVRTRASPRNRFV